MSEPLIHQGAIDRLIIRAANMLDYVSEEVALQTFVQEGCPMEVAVNAVRAGAILHEHRPAPDTRR